ncbi:MAG: hypothetical protein J7641_11930 [Cyanobacteria bacterium SID2]|nr:hypothetical protein [Cyanobacteria bacterium SID2]MBP0003012.1 hypothetical protein [Cyanobacteria bacterium SBC]
MNAAWHRIFRAIYRKEPISSFVLTVGAVDAALGGLGGSGSLLVFGLGTVGAAMALRWWQIQRHENRQPETAAPEYALPPSRASQPLPRLHPSSRNRPPLA